MAVNVQVNECLVHSSFVFSIEDLKARERIIYLFLLSWIFDVKMKERNKIKNNKNGMTETNRFFQLESFRNFKEFCEIWSHQHFNEQKSKWIVAHGFSSYQMSNKKNWLFSHFL